MAAFVGRATSVKLGAAMLKEVRSEDALRQARPEAAVDLLSVATAVPERVLTRDELTRRAQAFFPQHRRLQRLYGNTGIETRYTCLPVDWYEQPHGWGERTAVFQDHALRLLEQVAVDAVRQAGLALDDIDVIVTNTVTGLAIPSLDARLMNRLAFRRNIERVPMFGLGCGAGVAGLGRAARLAKAQPGSTVLFLTVDLCTLCFRSTDPSQTMFVATALFGDGAAGAVLQSGGAPSGDVADAQAGIARPGIAAWGEHLWPDSEHIMGWDIEDDGFGVVLSPELPLLMRDKFGAALDEFLAGQGLARNDLDGFLLHPGGRKVLEEAQKVLGVDETDLAHSWRVLRDYGNMSSATALFVLKEALGDKAHGRYLLAAFGPGFSAYFVLLDM